MATDTEIIQGIKSPGRYDCLVNLEDEGRRLLQQALPDAVELAPAVAGQPYPNPPSGCLKWFQRHPSEPQAGNPRPHFKYADWSRGKKGQGGSWGHIEF